ncbi:major facilitator superfamily domain-containing protein 8 [Chrysoperla carnea]|uniref:major facilitator superfamily domain-containing protein 8 n=1 Tax=Chrysoperla carnea TaxID=189513 RepID=UPI001D07871E|nr:major facilitator superfamily domain-containing protein 8 [Chrysoperla carnea]
MEWLTKQYRRIKKVPETNEQTVENDGLETDIEYRERWMSIRVIYFTMFLMSLAFSIILTGVWPYLDKLDKSAGKQFMGYIVGANPLGQMLFSPLFGWWSNRLGSIRLPLLVSLALFIIASGIYSTLEMFESYRKYWMLYARFLVGVSSANIAVCRSYLSAATRNTERTYAVSIISLAQVLGFIVGPGLQAAVVPLGDEGVDLIPGQLKLNMYTAAGWINVILGFVNFCLYLPMFFKEHKIAAREAMLKQGAESEKAAWKALKPDYFSAWTLIITFFVLVFNFMLLETLGTLLTMDQFAWTKAEALYYMGIMMSIGAVMACFTFVLISPLCKLFPERKVMIWGGIFFMCLGRLVHIPWGDGPIQIYDDTLIIDNNSTTPINGTELLGCPASQEWCAYTPKQTIFQFLLGYFLTTMGYPIGVTLVQTIFSKVLGPRPQGVWMGLMTGSGCFSRVMGPVFVSYIYTMYGTIWTFGITLAMMIGCQIWLIIFERRLIPVEDSAEKRQNFEKGTELQEMNHLHNASVEFHEEDVET